MDMASKLFTFTFTFTLACVYDQTAMWHEGTCTVNSGCIRWGQNAHLGGLSQ